MFCTSLRRRSFDSGSILTALTSPSTLGLRENDLATHDIALYVLPKGGPNTRQLRVLLLSPSTVSQSKLSGTIDRLLHLSHLTGGQDIAIAFVISPPASARAVSSRTLAQSPEDQGTNGMLAYCKLQSELMSHPELSIPILLMPTPQQLPVLLQNHLAAMCIPMIVQPPVATPFQLLQHCTVTPPLRQQTAFLMSDSFDNMRELAEGCCRILNSASELSSSPSFEEPFSGSDGGEDSEQKLKRLRDIIDITEWEGLVVFWQKEWAVE